VPPPEVTGGIKWRNAAYALQWWVFAAFAAFMWVKMVREDARRE
jgi:cytochrome oxidase assembly protein ShyY1